MMVMMMVMILKMKNLRGAMKRSEARFERTAIKAGAGRDSMLYTGSLIIMMMMVMMVMMVMIMIMRVHASRTLSRDYTLSGANLGKPETSDRIGRLFRFFLHRPLPSVDLMLRAQRTMFLKLAHPAIPCRSQAK